MSRDESIPEVAKHDERYIGQIERRLHRSLDPGIAVEVFSDHFFSDLRYPYFEPYSADEPIASARPSSSSSICSRVGGAPISVGCDCDTSVGPEDELLSGWQPNKIDVDDSCVGNSCC